MPPTPCLFFIAMPTLIKSQVSDLEYFFLNEINKYCYLDFFLFSYYSCLLPFLGIFTCSHSFQICPQQISYLTTPASPMEQMPPRPAQAAGSSQPKRHQRKAKTNQKNSSLERDGGLRVSFKEKRKKKGSQLNKSTLIKVNSRGHNPNLTTCEPLR